jgi:hypothetical protein
MSPLKHSVLIKTPLVNQDGNVNVAVQDQRTLTNMAEVKQLFVKMVISTKQSKCKRRGQLCENYSRW